MRPEAVGRTIIQALRNRQHGKPAQPGLDNSPSPTEHRPALATITHAPSNSLQRRRLVAAPPARATARPVTPEARPAAKPGLPAARAATPARGVVVPGEGVRTGLCFTAMVLNPLIQASQTVGMLARASFASPLLAGAAAFVVRGAGLLAASPIVNNPVTRGAMRAAGIALPFVNAGILAFDAYAAWQTVTNPAATRYRKGLTLARLGMNAIATALSFIPGNGAVLAMAPAWASIGLDLWIKRLNGKEGG